LTKIILRCTVSRSSRCDTVWSVRMHSTIMKLQPF